MTTKKNTTTAKSSIIPDTVTNPPVVKKTKKIKKKHHPKPTPVTPEVVVSKPIETVKTEESQNHLDIISFYGHNIRSTYTKNQWYFCLEDILKVANVIDPTKFLIDLKNQTDLKDNYYQFVDSFSYQENGNPIIIPVVNFQSFIQLLPYIRQIGSTIPGPFPDWLKNMANRSF